MIIPVGYAQVTHFFGGAGAPNGAATTYGIQLTGSVGGAQRAIDMHDAFTDHVMPNVSADITLERTLVKYGPNTTGPSYEFAGPVAGSILTASVPSNTSYLVQKRAVLGGRSNRGRMYIPGPPEASVGPGGLIDSGLVSNILADLGDWMTALSVVSAEMVILHNASSDPTTVDSLQISPYVATQRRRLRR